MKKTFLFEILCLVVLSVAVISVAKALARPQPSSGRASVVIDTDAVARRYDPMIFGGFLEHFGRQVYGGVFEPGSPLADEKGFLHLQHGLVRMKLKPKRQN